jgi:hypothetical protein
MRKLRQSFNKDTAAGFSAGIFNSRASGEDLAPPSFAKTRVFVRRNFENGRARRCAPKPSHPLASGVAISLVTT